MENIPQLSVDFQWTVEMKGEKYFDMPQSATNTLWCTQHLVRAGRTFLLFLLTYQVQWLPLRAVLKSNFQFDKVSAAVVVRK